MIRNWNALAPLSCRGLLASSSFGVDLLVVALAALLVLAGVVAYLDSHGSEKVLFMRFESVKLPGGLVAVWAFVAWLIDWCWIGYLLLECVILRLKFCVLALENRYLVSKQRKMLGLNRGRSVFFDKLLDICQWIHKGDSSANDERMHHYQRRRASITGLLS